MSKGLRYSQSKAITNLLEYFIIFISIIMSGVVVVFRYTQNLGFILLLFLFVLAVIFFSKKRTINKIAFIHLLLLLIYLILLLFLHKDTVSLNSYFGMMLRIVIGFFIINIVEEEVYINKYIDIVFIMCIISLFFYVIGILNPNYVMNLPILYDDVGTYFSTNNLHVYLRGVQGIFRNSGVFWEPGAFQVIINVAIFFQIYYLRNMNKLKLIIFCITIFSTMSTAGITILLLIYISIFDKIKSRMKYMYVLSAILIGIFTGFIEQKIFSKYDVNSSNGGSLNARLSAVQAEFEIIKEAPILGVGFEQYEKRFAEEMKRFEKNEGSSNSFTSLLALNGTIYFIIFIFYFVIFLIKISNRILEQIVILLSTIIMLSAEAFLLKLLFVIFMFYGSKKIFLKNKLGSENKNESESINNNSHLQC